MLVDFSLLGQYYLCKHCLCKGMSLRHQRLLELAGESNHPVVLDPKVVCDGLLDKTN